MATGTDKAPVHAPCWTELGSTDPEASKAFYAALFGWSAHIDPRPEAGGYTTMQIGDAPVAAITPQYAPGQPTAWTVSLRVKDADAIAASVEIAGGKALMPPMDVFDSGRFAVFTDPGGALFTVWQPREFDGARILGGPNSLGWVELATRDPKQAGEFYRHVFNWTAHPSEFYTEWSVGEGPHFGGMADLGRMGEGSVGIPPHWKPYFAVEDVDASAAAAAAAGASVLMPPDDVPDGGPRICVLQDPQGAPFGIYRAATAD
jgi:uncharacterized protein